MAEFGAVFPAGEGQERDEVSPTSPLPSPSQPCSGAWLPIAPPLPKHHDAGVKSPENSMKTSPPHPHLVLEVGVLVHDPLVDVGQQQLLLWGGQDGRRDEGDVRLRRLVPGLRRGPWGWRGARAGGRGGAGPPRIPSSRQEVLDGEGGPGWARSPRHRVPHGPRSAAGCPRGEGLAGRPPIISADYRVC